MVKSFQDCIVLVSELDRSETIGVQILIAKSIIFDRCVKAFTFYTNPEVDNFFPTLAAHWKFIPFAALNSSQLNSRKL